jgi:hypothetical protein
MKWEKKIEEKKSEVSKRRVLKGREKENFEKNEKKKSTFQISEGPIQAILDLPKSGRYRNVRANPKTSKTPFTL